MARRRANRGPETLRRTSRSNCQSINDLASSGTLRIRLRLWPVRQTLWCRYHSVSNSSNTLLVIDDDVASCELVQAIFRREGLAVVAAHDGPSGLHLISTQRPDAVLLDFELPGLSGLQVLERLKECPDAPPVVMLTASADVKVAVRATQLGAFDYLTKPIDRDEIILVARRAIETGKLRLEVADLRQRVRQDEAGHLVGRMGPSPQVAQVIEQVKVVAKSNFSVLIQGETGTGKELVAQAVHRYSDRRRKAFVALDCGAIPDTLLESELFGHERGAFSGAERRKQGHFQLADGGTCFLDEAGNLPIPLQAKLLRVLESRQLQPLGAEKPMAIDVRFVAATNDDLQARVARREFRSDLYFRLAQYTIVLPPLRDRPADIPFLTHRFIEEVSVELRRPVREVLPAAMDVLRDYQWPGNVRELRNVIRQIVLQLKGHVLRPEDVHPLLSGGAPAGGPGRPRTQSLRDVAEAAARTAERNAICSALRAVKGNKSQAAKVLQTDYKTLHLKMRLLEIDASDFRG